MGGGNGDWTPYLRGSGRLRHHRRRDQRRTRSPRLDTERAFVLEKGASSGTVGRAEGKLTALPRWSERTRIAVVRTLYGTLTAHRKVMSGRESVRRAHVWVAHLRHSPSAHVLGGGHCTPQHRDLGSQTVSSPSHRTVLTTPHGQPEAIQRQQTAAKAQRGEQARRADG